MVANLPYVSDGRVAGGLAAEIREYEPREALVAARPGSRRSRRCSGELALAEPLPGAVALEVGEGQAPTVAELVRRAGFERVETRRDLAGIERVVVGGEGSERAEARRREAPV